MPTLSGNSVSVSQVAFHICCKWSIPLTKLLPVLRSHKALALFCADIPSPWYMLLQNNCRKMTLLNSTSGSPPVALLLSAMRRCLHKGNISSNTFFSSPGSMSSIKVCSTLLTDVCAPSLPNSLLILEISTSWTPGWLASASNCVRHQLH